MNVNVALAIAKYVKKDGNAAIVVRVSQGHQTRELSTGYKIPLAHWDDDKRKVKNTYEGVTSVARLNNLIAAELKAVNDKLIELEDAGVLSTLTITDIMSRLSNKGNRDCFFKFADSQIANLKAAKRISNMNAYNDAANAIKNFHGSRSISFKSITPEFLRRMEAKHLEKGNKLNGFAAYMRSVRAIYNLAIDDGLVDKKYYPFEKFSIRTERTQKRSISKELLQNIVSLKLLPHHPCFDARNKFLISYMLYGMNFCDMVMLTKDNIVNGRIEYQRNKTTAPFNVLITPTLQALLNLYIKSEQHSIFNVVKRTDPVLANKDVKNARRLFNDRLKDLAKLCGIETNLTSYVSRHSFATHAKLHKIPVEAISEMLGHTSIKTTQIYLDSLPSTTLDEYNATVLDMVGQAI
jgi:integrase/recombinase XerD